MSILTESKELEIPFLDLPDVTLLEDISSCLASLASEQIAVNTWPIYPTNVKANFTIAHNGEFIFLKYNIKEAHLVAEATTNGKISKDSCVEFFIAFGEEESYYNLEFNCLGWCKIGYGQGRKKRTMLDPSLVESISSNTKINSFVINKIKDFSWEITLAIPINVFCFSNIKSFFGVKAKGNFYKCGDGLPQPHFLTWHPVETPEPDFHRPEYFCGLSFS